MDVDSEVRTDELFEADDGVSACSAVVGDGVDEELGPFVRLTVSGVLPPVEKDPEPYLYSWRRILAPQNDDGSPGQRHEHSSWFPAMMLFSCNSLSQ